MEILVNFNELYPSDMWSDKTQESFTGNGKGGALGNFQICGKEVPRGYWVSTPNSQSIVVIIKSLIGLAKL